MKPNLILFFNSMWGQPLLVDGLDLPEGFRLTTDRQRFEEATAVVFHIPDMGPMDGLTKHPGQIWVAWSMECDIHFSHLQDPQFMKRFDLKMTYHLDADIPVTYIPQDGKGLYETFGPPPKAKTKSKLAALFLSSQYDRSGRTGYVTELMRYLNIHAYGRLLRNRHLDGDRGRVTKLKTIAGYKFTLCFENALAKDYVTENFFDPLLAGSVPVYRGAPNIDAFAPGKNCFINIADFKNPKALSEYLIELNEDDETYERYHAWRQKDLATGFIRLRDEQREPAFVRLCRKVLALKESQKERRAMASFSHKRQSVKVSLLKRGKTIDTSMIDVDKYLFLFRRAEIPPLVSCLMVTRNRPTMARRAINCFLRQTYPNRELVIIDDGRDHTLEQWIREVGDDRIVYLRQPDEGKPLGDLRNLSVAKAGGTYVTQWDDDDLSDPERLEVQMAVIHVLQTDCCFLERHQIWWPETRRLALSTRRVWEGSFICAKDKLPPYPPLPKGEDTPVINRIFRENRAALLDFPSLYVYIYHGKNTFDAPHWERHWGAATKTFEKDVYNFEEGELKKRFGAALTP